MLSIIVAMSDRGRIIGLKGGLPWNLSADLKRFKKITTGHTVIMGRNTWESIPERFRPLPNRQNIVLSRQEGYIDRVPAGVGVSKSLEEALHTHAALTQTPMASKWGDVFVIGGERVFVEALPLADRLYLTVVDYDGDGDVFFPANPWEYFEETEDVTEKETIELDEKNSNASRFLVMTRKTRKTT